MSIRVSLTVDGKPVDVDEGTSIAAAVLSANGLAFRRSVDGNQRGPLCGMGTCFECRATVNGREHVRTCVTFCENGMTVDTGV